MRVLITGATGKIGRVLAASLVDVGISVRILTRRPHRVVEAFGDSMEAFEWHPISEPVPAHAFDDVSTLIHLMGDPLHGRLSPEKLKRLGCSRVTSLERLIAAAGDKPVRWIVASSVGVYPGRGARSSDAGTEQNAIAADIAADKITSPLQTVVSQWEAAAQPLKDKGDAVAFVRLGHVICADGFPLPLMSLRAQGLDLPLEPQCSVPVISLPDAAALFAWLVLNPRVTGPINGVAPVVLQGAALNEALESIADGRRRWPLSAWLAQKRLGILADLICGDRLVLPKRALDGGFQFSNPDPLLPLRAAIKTQNATLCAARTAAALPSWLGKGGMRTKVDSGSTAKKAPRP